MQNKNKATDQRDSLPCNGSIQGILTAYNGLDEAMKSLICREVADSCPNVFRKWCRATGALRRFRPEYARGRKGVAAQLLDRALGEECNGNLVRHVLCGFFTQGKTGRALNDFFLSIAQPSYESPDRVVKAIHALNLLGDRYNERFPGLILLYTACLKVFYPEWFDSCLPVRQSASDEKRISFGGVETCVVHDVDSDSAEAEEVVQCHCSTVFLTQTDRILDDFDAAMKKLMAITRDVPARPIDESKDLLEQFSTAHGVAVECARAVLKKYDEVRDWEPSNDPCCDETGCALCGHGGLEELKYPPSLSAIEEGAVQLRTLVTKTRSAMSDLKSQFDETVRSIEKLADYSEDEIGFDRALPLDNALHMARALIEMKELLELIKQERAEQLEAIRRKATSELADFRSSNRLTEKEEQDIARLNSELADANELKGLRSIVEKAETFKVEAEVRIMAKDYVAASEKVLGTATDPVSHLRLVGCCLKSEQPELAYCLLDMVQEKWQYDDMFLADGVPTPESVLTTVTEACVSVAGLARVPWPVLLANQPWIAALSRTDIESKKTRGILTTAWAAALSLWPNDPVLESRFRQHCDLEALPEADCPTMTLLVGKLRDGHSTIICDVHEDHVLREVQGQIDEWLKREHGHFVHVVTRGVDHLARVEHDEILPDLAARWARITDCCDRGVFAVAKSSASFVPEQLYREALKRSSVGTKRDHEHRTPKLLERMSKIREHFDSFIETCERRSATGEAHASRQELIRETEAFIEREQPLSAICQPLLDLLVSGAAEDAKGYEREAVLLTLGQQRADLVRWLHPLLTHIETKPLSQAGIAESVLADVCKAIARPLKDEDLTTLLRNGECLKEVAILQGTREAQDEFERFGRKLTDDLDELSRQAGEGVLLREASVALVHGRYPRAAVLVRQVTDQLQEQRRRQGKEQEKVFKALITQVGNIATEAAMCSAGDQWVEKFQSTCARLQRTAADLLHKAKAANVAADQIERTQKARDVLLYMVGNMSRDFTEIDRLLSITEASVALISPIECEELPACWERLRLDEENRGYREEALTLWRSFSDGSPSHRGLNTEWGRFTIAFGKITGLLYGQVAADSEKEGVRPVRIEGLSVDGRQTLFRHRHSRFFEQPVFLYLIPGARPRDAELRTLRDHLLQCPEEFLHLVALPGDAEHARTILREVAGTRRVLLLEEEPLDVLLRDAEPGRALRQMFLSTVPLTSVSPFKSDGRVLGDCNIYVGREKPLQLLLNQDHSWISGGRRIGKSSLLHRLAHRLRNAKSPSWSVAPVNAQHIMPGDDADLMICQNIMSEFGFTPAPSTVDQFRADLSALVRRGHAAILIDEVDSYITVSREKHGDGFPLAKALRSVAQDAPGGHLKVVMAGFKALFSEVKRTVEKTDFPFNNFLTETPGLGPLDDGETRDLLELGFTNTLGIEFDACVPRHVRECTGGHPAFVQEFCNCLLRRLETHRQDGQIRLTEDDVKSVFAEDAVKDGQSPFIEFIHGTLSMNLSIIERAVFTLMVHNVEGLHPALSRTFTAEWVRREIGGFVSKCPSLDSDVEQALRMLVMTGMLNREGKSYRIAIPSYEGILRRLDECGKDVIEDLLTEYQTSEAKQ